MNVIELNLNDIVFTKGNPRIDCPVEYLVALAEDIKKNGQRNPILVSLKDERYFLIAGECRIRALRINGCMTVMARVYDNLSPEEFDTLAIQDNISCLSLSPIEIGIALSRMGEKYRWTQQVLAQKLGKSQKWVSNCLSLVGKLSPEVQALIRNNTMKQSFARLIKRVPLDSQKAIADSIVQGKMHMNAAEVYIKQQLGHSTTIPNVRRMIAEFGRGAAILGHISAQYFDLKQELPKGLATELSKACLEYAKVKDRLTMWILHSAAKEREEPQQDLQNKSI